MKKEELKRIEEWCETVIFYLRGASKRETPKKIILSGTNDNKFPAEVLLHSGIEYVSEALKIPVHIEIDPVFTIHYLKVVTHKGIRFIQMMPYSGVMFH